jgi:hypothetical protein
VPRRRPPPNLSSIDQPIESNGQESNMNDEATYTYATADTVAGAMMVGSLAASSLLLAVAYCAQALAA